MMKLTRVDSTMLSMIGFDAETSELEAVYVDGAVWRYRGVPETVHRSLLASDSIGGYMRDFVIDVYPACCVRRRR